MQFGEKLKQCRKSRKLTQAALAGLLNVSQSTVGNWEAGTREPDLSMINKIASALDIPVSHLMDTAIDDASPHVAPAEGSQPIYVKKTFTPTPVKPSGVELLADPVETVTLKPDDRRAALLFSTLPDDKKKDALSYIQYLADKAD